jgi:hypothetical protein
MSVAFAAMVASGRLRTGLPDTKYAGPGVAIRDQVDPFRGT